jgi:hypothetical protein
VNPFDYSLCNQTVTLYRRENGQVIRKVIFNAYFSGQIAVPTEIFGKSKEKKFLLIIPGDFPLQPGDRIYDGNGPETVDWESFLPVSVPGLSQVTTAESYRFRGEFHHWEATH